MFVGSCPDLTKEQGLSGMVQPVERAVGAAGGARLATGGPGLRAGLSAGGATGFVLVLAAVWLLGFQLLFYAQSFVDPDVARGQLWLMLLDEVLGAEDGVAATGVPTGWQFAVQRLPLAGVAGCLLLLCGVHGWAVDCWLLRRVPLGRFERCCLAAGVGLSVQSLVVLLAGLCGVLSGVVLVLAAAVSLAAGLAGAKRSAAAGSAAGEGRVGGVEGVLGRRAGGRFECWLFWLVAVPWSVYLLWGAMTPPTDFDVREYHLQGPKEWYQDGRIHYLRHNVYTSFPFLSEMHSLSAMVLAGDWWRGALAGQLVLAVYQLLTCGVVVAAGFRWCGRGSGYLAGLIWLTTPWTLRISLIAYAEGALSFYTAAAILLSLSVGRLPADGVRCRALLVVGFLAGSAMAAKYTGLLLAVIPTAVGWSWWWCRAGGGVSGLLRAGELRRGFVREAGLYVAGVLLAVGPWLLKNAAETGNPVFPMAWSVFGGGEWNEPLNERWKRAHGAPEHSLVRIPQHFLDAAVRNKWTSPLLFGLSVPVLLCCVRSVPLRLVWLSAGWGFLTWWGLTHRIDRFWVPVVPLLSVLAGAVVLVSIAGWWRGLVVGSVVTGTVFNLRFSTLALVGFHAGLMDLEGARELVIRSDLRVLNEQLPGGARVLMVGEAEVFDARFAVLYSTVFDDSVFEELTGGTDTGVGTVRVLAAAAEVRERLRAAGVTHVLVNWREVLRYRLPGSYGYAEYVQPERFEQLQEQGVLGAARVLGQSSWAGLSETERRVVQQWPGWQQLVRGDVWETVRLYEVR